MQLLKSILLISLILGSALSAFSTDLKIDIPENYVTYSAQEKRDWIWEQGILPTEFSNLPEFEDIKILKLMFMKLKKKMNHEYDFRPKKWSKPIHRRSVVAKMKFVPAENSKFTGIYAGETLGLVRASLTYIPKKRGVAPGIAMKFFVDGKTSVDASFLTGLDSHGQNYNFFAKPFTNIVPKSKKAGAKIVAAIFRRAAKKTNYISVEHLAKVAANGQQVANAKSPIQLFLVAANEIEFKALPARDIREDLMTLEEGTTLFNVYARDYENQKDYKKVTIDKNAKNLKAAKLIGTIVLESKFKASSFGDDQLFFRHQKFKNKSLK